MRQATPGQRDLARRLLDHEARGGQSPAELADALEAACQRLSRNLSRLIGLAGVEAVFARALHLAKAGFPFLDGVEVALRGGAVLKGLQERVQGQGPAAVGDGLAAVLANTIWLLSTFIGEDLAGRQVREVWPDVLPEAGSAGPKEAD